jgi:hypothetical protein
MTDLNSVVDLPSGVILISALDINNAGQVIATGLVPVTAIPEPEIYALFLAGLGLMGFMARRKRGEKDDGLQEAGFLAPTGRLVLVK